MTSQHRRHHIATARELARDLRDAAARFDEVALGNLAPAELWPAMQPDAALVARFRAFLEKLWFDGIRSRFFAEFDASKLILPIATDVACRLDKLVIELEMQIAACEERARCAAAGGEVRVEN
ncbi:MAG: hypothetical protein WC538_10520 [Thermoanaerobaculia bacterium]|jgi:hypothetical protein